MRRTLSVAFVFCAVAGTAQTLPAVFVDGVLALRGAYPTAAQGAEWLNAVGAASRP